MNKAALVEDLIVCVLHEPTLVATIVGFTKYFPFEMVKINYVRQQTQQTPPINPTKLI